MVWFAIPFLLVINLWTIVCFCQDKQRAIARARRISEADLLTLAAIGGSPGALLARRWFRHKTRKEPFSTRPLLICAIQMGLALGFWIL
ncbi:DUF1294 domain-containing protein [Sphingomonas glacialis]|uniref:DUF1294 domain-containing protein n=1 Tax=Sphingomonas glacialis TaxID=658225 RepID=A0A502FXY4_9SPHN|nr:DUF1294 domain-containing protein [Sphingomonas glacialis]TPG53926.1 DUF1294 domain-containing protein [Sphingomonas glacialis]